MDFSHHLRDFSHRNVLLAIVGIELRGGVVPERLRTLDHGRPWRDDQFAACRVSSSRDMSR